MSSPGAAARTLPRWMSSGARRALQKERLVNEAEKLIDSTDLGPDRVPAQGIDAAEWKEAGRAAKSGR